MSALQDIVDMFAKGGLEITTFDNDDRDNGRAPLIRTVIQPNANIITLVRPGMDNSVVWERHHGKLQDQVRSIRRIRQRLNEISFVAIVAYIISINLMIGEPSSWSLHLPQGPGDLLPLLTEEPYSGFVRLVVSIFGAYLIRLILRLALRWYIRRRINKYVASFT